jgi:hypothetical protein
MKIEDVHILNWEPTGYPAGSQWWADRAAAPDEPESVHAKLTVKMSYAEYKELLQKDLAARASIQAGKPAE